MKLLGEENIPFRPAPLLGENNKEVLTEFLNIDEKKLEEYKKGEII